MQGINSELNELSKQHLDVLEKQFSAASPFEHIQFDDFLEPEFCEKLLAEFPSFDKALALNENGEIGKKAVNEHMADISPAYRNLDQLVQSNAFISMVSEVTGISGLLYDKHYFGGGTHENLHGQGLDPHVDFTHHPVTNYYRRLNLIIYLNKAWSDEWGGCLDLYKNPYDRPEDDEIVRIKPLFNRAVIFATHHHSWHGFEPIELPSEKQKTSRKSIALYYYTKTKPTWFERAHSTIYVDRHINPKIQVGRELTAADLNEINHLIAVRDEHIKRLYKVTSHQMNKLNKLKIVFGPFWRFSWRLRKTLNWFLKR